MNAISEVKRAAFLLGGASALAERVGAAPQLVWQWSNQVRPVSERACPAIEHATAGAVTCEQLRPDAPWLRVPDPEWPHPLGRPVLDVARAVPARKEKTK